ncbi:putative fatty acyl-CoA reductase CG5065 [Caerostris extrusa]|uniref:Fatty acyl-CoA reductase n=1 Tax=Caerostris extrusa TaxID=172846 RepID=A0AAV4W8C6_CAEEX|nr:putative fatty acyl-CoA reductase CG5065 [Caerostris extrusa]
MSESVENKNHSVSISKFYEGKSIFITGAAGFVGVVLLEILLRCCGGIKSIYILLREKKGVSPQARKEEIFKRSVLVYTSTAYSNCNRKLKIEERVYRLPYEAQRFIDAVDSGKEELLQQIASECQPRWPNHYSFSKCIAENLLIEKASDIPTAIIRPSLIGPIWKGALPGYVEENSSLAQLLIAISKGFLKVLPAHPKVCLDFIPADIVANAHVIAACRLATQSDPSPFVVNCSSHGSYEYRIDEQIHVVTEVSMKKYDSS